MPKNAEFNFLKMCVNILAPPAYHVQVVKAFMYECMYVLYVFICLFVKKCLIIVYNIALYGRMSL